MSDFATNNNGFTFIEVIAVLVILVIAGALIVGRSGNQPSASLISQSDVLRAHLRYAQTMAMGKSGPDDIFGIKCDGNYYWMFQGTDPDSNIVLLPDEPGFNTNNDGKLDLSAKGISLVSPNAFSVFFDGKGIPYSAYTDESDNTPLGADMTLNLSPSGAASPTETITLTQHTGFVP